jgi:hypothetical protein
MSSWRIYHAGMAGLFSGTLVGDIGLKAAASAGIGAG